MARPARLESGPVRTEPPLSLWRRRPPPGIVKTTQMGYAITVAPAPDTGHRSGRGGGRRRSRATREEAWDARGRMPRSSPRRTSSASWMPQRGRAERRRTPPVRFDRGRSSASPDSRVNWFRANPCLPRFCGGARHSTTVVRDRDLVLVGPEVRGAIDLPHRRLPAPRSPVLRLSTNPAVVSCRAVRGDAGDLSNLRSSAKSTYSNYAILTMPARAAPAMLATARRTS
jgi:hypothetical protein